jgi:hypothetical protein
MTYILSLEKSDQIFCEKKNFFHHKYATTKKRFYKEFTLQGSFLAIF